MELHFFLEQLDGQRRELVHPVSFSLVRSADTPADSLKAEFMVPTRRNGNRKLPASSCRRKESGCSAASVTGRLWR